MARHRSDLPRTALTCSFCGAVRDQSGVVRGPQVAICEDCAVRAADVFARKREVAADADTIDLRDDEVEPATQG